MRTFIMNYSLSLFNPEKLFEFHLKLIKVKRFLEVCPGTQVPGFFDIRPCR